MTDEKFFQMILETRIAFEKGCGEEMERVRRRRIREEELIRKYEERK